MGGFGGERFRSWVRGLSPWRRSQVGRVLFRTPALAALRRQQRRRGGVTVLMYQRLGDPQFMDANLFVGAANFEDQVRYLAAHYRLMPLEEGLARLAAGRALPAGGVVVTSTTASGTSTRPPRRSYGPTGAPQRCSSAPGRWIRGRRSGQSRSITGSPRRLPGSCGSRCRKGSSTAAEEARGSMPSASTVLPSEGGRGGK